MRASAMAGAVWLRTDKADCAIFATPTWVAEACARFVAASVATAAARYRAVHAKKPGKAKACSCNAATLVAALVGAKVLATCSTVACPTLALSFLRAGSTIIAIFRAWFSGQLPQCGCGQKAVDTFRCWQWWSSPQGLHQCLPQRRD